MRLAKQISSIGQLLRTISMHLQYDQPITLTQPYSRVISFSELLQSKLKQDSMTRDNGQIFEAEIGKNVGRSKVIPAFTPLNSIWMSFALNFTDTSFFCPIFFHLNCTELESQTHYSDFEIRLSKRPLMFDCINRQGEGSQWVAVLIYVHKCLIACPVCLWGRPFTMINF